jgi:3-hydroxybutyryl-CoA dehydrogenase
MGTGIGIVAAKNAGLHVKIVDSNQDMLINSRKFMELFLEKAIKKQRMTSEERYNLLAKFSYSSNLEDLNDADFVVEVFIRYLTLKAVVEDFSVKKTLFETLDKVINQNCILASNTSSISLTKIAATT